MFHKRDYRLLKLRSRRIRSREFHKRLAQTEQEVNLQKNETPVSNNSDIHKFTSENFTNQNNIELIIEETKIPKSVYEDSEGTSNQEKGESAFSADRK